MHVLYYESSLEIYDSFEYISYIFLYGLKIINTTKYIANIDIVIK
jgi:hypothetical protein